MITASTTIAQTKTNSTFKILIASLIGTTIEFFDFYVFATAAALVFPSLFFPQSDANAALLQSFAVFSVAFFARPIGSVVFGHFGDRVGRKATLVAALLTTGISTVIIGLLPTYSSIGWISALLLTLCRFGQGIGLGGEWGGAVLLAVENAPADKKGWYSMFPQLGAPIGLLLSAATYWLLWSFVTHDQLLNWAWRLPFIASLILIIIGLWVRVSMSETPEFQMAIEREERVKFPIFSVFLRFPRSLFLGTFAGMTTFLLFYLFTAYLLTFSTNHLGLTYSAALEIEMIGALVFGLVIPVAGKVSDYIGRRLLMILVTFFIAVFSFFIPPLLEGGISGVVVLSIIGMATMGLTYGPIGATLASPFPTSIRYTGASMTFNLAGIVGASFAPYIAEYLISHFGVVYVGYYVLLSAFISLTCFIGFNREEISN